MADATHSRPVQWLIAAAALVALTAAMLVFRDRLDKAHVALLYLLVVLGGSAVGGRWLGIAVGGVSFFLFNFFFLPPYSTLRITDPLDWLVLVVFLITSIVAAELLGRQRREATLAENRRRELDQLSTLGAETLNAPRAEQALAAIAGVIRTTLRVDRCELYVRGESQTDADESLQLIADEGGVGGVGAGSDAHGLLRFIIDSGRAAVSRADGTVHVMEDREGHSPGVVENVRDVAIPLIARGQTVGALRLSRATVFSLNADEQRVLSALAYYAALGIERLRRQAAEEAAETLRRADRMKDALLAAVSHDLRTPLTTIKGIAHEIAHGGDTDRANVIEEEADHLASLVDALLELSQLRAGAVPVRPELNTLDDLVGTALQKAESVLRSHPVDVDLGHDPLLIGRFDLTHSLRIVVNLLENAAKYSAADAPITVAARRVGDRLRIEVFDRGPGVPLEERERIFEPFYRAQGTMVDVRGAGLGLSIAKQLAQAQHGDLGVTAHAGGGSVFTLELPAADLPVSGRHAG